MNVVFFSGTVGLNDFVLVWSARNYDGNFISFFFNSEDQNAPIKVVPYSEQKIIHMQNGLSVASAYGQLSLNEITNRGKAFSIRILINPPG